MKEDLAVLVLIFNNILQNDWSDFQVVLTLTLEVYDINLNNFKNQKFSNIFFFMKMDLRQGACFFN